MLKTLKKIVPFAIMALPLVAAAQGRTLEDILQTLARLLNTATIVVIGLGVVYFLYGLATYFLGGAEAKDGARQMMLNGIIILAVMVGIWGLVQVLLVTFLGGTTFTTPPAPGLPT